MTSIIKRHGLDNHCYADDTQVHFSCKPEDVNTLVKAFTACTDDLTALMRSNKLKLNCDKTECIWIANGQRQRSFSAPTVTVGGVAVRSSSGELNLGVYFDKSISFGATYLQRLQKLLFLTATNYACYPPFFAV